MSSLNIQDFMSKGLIYGGARPSLFQVYMSLPPNIGLPNVGAISEKIAFTCRAASLPSNDVAPVEVGFFGRKIKLAGDRTYPDWTITIMNDEDYLVRHAMEQWNNALNSAMGNIRLVEQGSYKQTATVVALSKNGNAIASYDFIGIFPTSVGAMDVDWDNTNTIQNFQVTFAYDLWLPSVNANPAIGVPGLPAAYTGTEDAPIEA